MSNLGFNRQLGGFGFGAIKNFVRLLPLPYCFIFPVLAVIFCVKLYYCKDLESCIFTVIFIRHVSCILIHFVCKLVATRDARCKTTLISTVRVILFCGTWLTFGIDQSLILNYGLGIQTQGEKGDSCTKIFL